jgi:hypothetical protein
MKRRWDDDVVFKNQARGTENRDGKEFVNVCPHSLPYCRERKLTQLTGSPALRFPQAVHGMYSTLARSIQRLT